MSAGDIDAVRFGVFARGRPLEESEWKAIELLRAAGPSEEESLAREGRSVKEGLYGSLSEAAVGR